MKIISLAFATIIFGFFMPWANAASQPTPEKACHFLDNMPFINAPSKYTPIYEGSKNYECGTHYFSITTSNKGYGLDNNIAYYASGTQSSVNKVMLMLNINDQGDNSLKVSKAFYINGAFEMLKKMFPAQPDKTTDIIEILNTGRDGEWMIDGWKITSIKDLWPTGKGYEYRFTISFE